MKRILFLSIAILACIGLSAQQYKELWISGSAVPGGVQKLEKVSDTDFKYAGALKAGELFVTTTKKDGKATRFLAAGVADANIVNRGIGYREKTDKDGAAWQVVVADDHYRFHVLVDEKRLQGEIFQPWGELFIAGGATGTKWQKAEGHMLLMKQNVENPYIWSWEGVLSRHDDVEEPASFKFEGQDRWRPKELHPYAADTDILVDQRLRTFGSDTKWTISKEGRYRIVVDLFKETVKAELLK